MKGTQKYYRQGIVQLLFAIIFFIYMATFLIDQEIFSGTPGGANRYFWFVIAALNILPALLPQLAVSSEGIHFNILGFRKSTLAWNDIYGFLQVKNNLYLLSSLENGLRVNRVVPLYGLRRKGHLIERLKEHCKETPPDEAIRSLRESLPQESPADRGVRNISLTENTINFSHIYSKDLSIPYENIRHLEFRPPVFHTGHHVLHYTGNDGQLKKHRFRIYPDKQHMHFLSALIKRIPHAELDPNLLRHNGLFNIEARLPQKREVSTRTTWSVIAGAVFLILVLPVMAYVMKYEDASFFDALYQGLLLVFILAATFSLIFFPLLLLVKVGQKSLSAPSKQNSKKQGR